MQELLRLMRYARPYVLRLMASVVLMFGVGILDATTILFIRPVLDRVLHPEVDGPVLLFTIPYFDRPVFLNQFLPAYFHNIFTMMAVSILTVAMGKAVCEYAGDYLVHYIGFAVISDLRNQVYEKVIRQSARFFRDHSTGKLMSAIVNDIEKIQLAVSHLLADFLRQSFTLIAMIGLLIAMDPKLALIALPLLVAVVLSFSVRIGGSVRKSSRKTQDNVADISQILQETISGNRIVKAFGMEGFEVRRFREAARRLFQINLRYVRAQALSSPLMELLGGVMIVSLLAVGRQQILAAKLTAGAFLVFIITLLKLYEPVKRLAGINNAFHQALGASSVVFEYLDLPDEIADRPGATPMAVFQKSVEFDNVRFSYDGGAPVLRDIRLHAKHGQMIAIVGTSGVGKTTLVNLLPRFFDVTSGRVLLDGRDVRDITISSLRAQIGMVTQETILFHDTVHNNIAYGRPSATQAEIEASARAALAHDFIVQLPQGYDTMIGERGQRLSGGQRQRLAIARALLKNAPLLILDEATSELDTESEREVQKALANLIEGRTVFVIAHRLSTIHRADRIIVLDGGGIAESGTHDELIALGGLYRKLYEMQFEGVARRA
jgi:ATP-binding cassette, subfamily B, bacterial MsbA